jgi:phage terminase large subunit
MTALLPSLLQPTRKATKVRLPNNWEPRHYQRNLWKYLWNGGKRAIAIWHRRAGKDDICLHWAAVSMIRRPATYWHMLPEYAQGRRAIWTAINPHSGKRRIDEAFPHELRATTNEQEMFIRFKNGATWQVVGSDNFNSIVGSPPAGVVFSEWALANPSAWAYIAPILAENGGWACFITTPRGRNHAKSMVDMAKTRDDWFTEVLTIDDTKAISREMVESQRQEYHGIYGPEAGDALIEQEFFASFSAAIIGSYWGKELDRAEQEGRIGLALEPVEDLPVHTAWDLGIDDSMAIWVYQIIPPTRDEGTTIHMLDYYENSGHGMRHYTDALDAIRVNLGFKRYGFDYVPPDARARMLDEEGRNRIQVLQALGRKPRLVLPHKLIDGINAARITLPRVKFANTPGVRKGVELLRQYRADFDEKTRVFRQAPKHDFSSHCADAFRYMAMAWKNIALQEPDMEEHERRMAKPVTLNDMTVDQYLATMKKAKARSARI